MLVKVIISLYYLVFMTSHIIIMLLIMTMNAYVIIAICLGWTIGYFIFEVLLENKAYAK